MPTIESNSCDPFLLMQYNFKKHFHPCLKLILFHQKGVDDVTFIKKLYNTSQKKEVHLYFAIPQLQSQKRFCLGEFF